MTDFGISDNILTWVIKLDDILYTSEITVLGVGNTILTDEGFGVHVVEHLKQNFEFPQNVQLSDGGTLGVELTHFITGTKKLLIIDSINGEQPAGTTFKFINDEVIAHFREKISAHEVGIQEVLTMLELTGHKIPEVVVIGAQPYDLDAGTELSPNMKMLIPVVTDMAINILKSWNIQIKPV